SLVRQASRGSAPVWLHEGIAQWCEGRRLPPRDASAAVGPAPAGSLDALGRRFGSRLHAATARASYAEALSLVEHLVDQRGEGALRCVLARLAAREPFREALWSETGLSPEQLYEGWRKWAKV